MELKRKNLTIDDVRNALAGNDDSDSIDPFKTHASAIHKVIGRGSMATIQKFLTVIRDELKSEAVSKEDAPAAIVKPDSESVLAIWDSVVRLAHTAHLEVIESLNCSREALRAELSTANNDVIELTSAIESLELMIADKDDELSRYKNKSEDYIKEVSDAVSRLDESHSQINQLNALIEKMVGTQGEHKERKQRTAITPEVIELVISLDGQPAQDVADQAGISLGSVNKIRKENAVKKHG